MANVKGSRNSETLRATDADDAIFALGGHDTIIGSYGRDYIDGGSGRDTVDYSAFFNDIAVVLRGSAEVIASFDGRDRDTLLNVENVTGGSGDDYFGGDEQDNIFRGNAGHDYFVSSGGSDTYYGGSGYDMVDYSDVGTGLLIRPTGYGYSAVIAGGIAYDSLYSIENVIGTDFDDRMIGGSANNLFIGGKGNDALSGGAGGDVLLGGRGNDHLSGGADSDIFEFTDRFGRDVITDFRAYNDGNDVIDLSDVATITDFDDLMDNHVWIKGIDVIIDAGGGNVITLRDVALNDISEDEFLF